MKWLTVRHGETDWNRQGRVQGQTDVPLNDEGRAQAAALGKALHGVQIDTAFSSDLSRAHETAKLVLGERPIDIGVTSNLREMKYGSYEGLIFEELARHDPGYYSAWHNGDPELAAPNGENFHQLYERVSVFVRELKDKIQGDTVLIVAHGGSIRALLLILLGLPIKAFYHFSIASGGLAVVERDRNRNTLKLYNAKGLT